MLRFLARDRGLRTQIPPRLRFLHLFLISLFVARCFRVHSTDFALDTFITENVRRFKRLRMRAPTLSLARRTVGHTYSLSLPHFAHFLAHVLSSCLHCLDTHSLTRQVCHSLLTTVSIPVCICAQVRMYFRS